VSIRLPLDQSLRAHGSAAAGRTCPVDYVYSPSVFDRPPEIATDVLYVVGGLYGNLAALEELELLLAAERTPATVVLNGDFHWFDAEPAWFAEVERRVTGNPALRGNIETEIARLADVGAGCGCAYPDHVADDVVARSNAILAALRVTVPTTSAAARRLGTLPMHLVAAVGDLRIGIVHGDATSLGGWRFDRAALDEEGARRWLNSVRARSRIDVFASTHTCVPALREFALPAGRLIVINNGAAGMPNFTGLRAGLITRIATLPSPHQSLYGLVRESVHVDAVALAYDTPAFLDRFLARWPAGSPAYGSYCRRIVAGPHDTATQAARAPARAEMAAVV
jgi:hypothetical protein